MLQQYWGACGVALVVGASIFVSGCASDDERPESLVLDAREEHYGKSYAEWSAEWLEYVNRHAPPECANPLADTTGEACDVDQDPESPVFFLVGAFGGTFERECTVPAGKALFLPLINTWADNAGVPEEAHLSPDELRDYVEMSQDSTEGEKMYLRVDGVDIESLTQGGVRSAPYTVDLAEGGNAYTCAELDGVVGRFDGYVSGYWIMLKPLSPGSHVIEFGTERTTNSVSGDIFELHVTYLLEVD